MAKPILFSVDDDASVLRAIERDLRSQYGAEYRVMASDSPQQALDVLKQLKLRSDTVALLLADQRMPQMDGVGFLQEAMRIYPDAKRALLTAYADTSAAISAINDANINYFFMKPWDPPNVHLYPQLDDLLDDWKASYRPAFEGIRVLGTRWSPRSYELRDFLARALSVDRRGVDGERYRNQAFARGTGRRRHTASGGSVPRRNQVP
jgi:thioredoxin reductase (NADPH)